MDGKTILKRDLFGEVALEVVDGEPVIARNIAAAPWWSRGLARRLLQREARALAALEGVGGVPAIVATERDRLLRSYLAGEPLYRAKPREAAWFRAAARLVRRLHRAGVCHNDLAKEPNLLVLANGAPGIIDFQLATHSRNRSRLFRIAAYEDIRHLLKHKRTYRPDLLTAREQRILANPSPVSRLWMRTFKPAYLFVTRRLLGWADREGAADRDSLR
ncbi:MAG: phosphotransferase [Woeseiaceae bacterium]|jgi:predicted Ser/Thr protein kinase